MQSITDILRQKAEQQKPQQSLPSSTQCHAVIETYGTKEQFLKAFNPGMQLKVCADPWQCILADVPTLSQLDAAYGEYTAASWLVPQLYDLSEFCGCKDKLQGVPLKQCAAIIATDYHYLKPTELMLFFHRFKQGRYGRFYGSVDPLVITTSLRDFIQERNAALIHHEQHQRQAEYEEYKKHAITYEEYQARKQQRENTKS